MMRKARERLAAEQIQRNGGSVTYDYESDTGKPYGPEWLRKFLGDNFFSKVVMVTLGKETPLKCLKDLPELENLDLDEHRLTDTDLEQLRSLTQLQELTMRENDITDAGLLHLEGL